MKKKAGFTLLEIIIIGAFATFLIIFFIMQKTNLDAFARDEKRKTAINAIYYALEEDFYKKNGYYPEFISEKNITVIDPALWTDPNGYNIGNRLCSYSYQAANCNDGKCKEYTLQTTLEKEATYTKYNRN